MSATDGIIKRDDNWLQMVRDGKIVATARRQNQGTLWFVFLRDYIADSHGRRAPAHARVSGKLPEDVQRKLLHAILEAA